MDERQYRRSEAAKGDAAGPKPVSTPGAASGSAPDSARGGATGPAPGSAPGSASGAAPGPASGPAPAAEPLAHVEPFPVRVRFVEHTSSGAWQVSQWRPEAVEPTGPADPASVALEVFVDEAEGYYLNLTSGDPSIMIRWRLPEDESGIAGEPGEPKALAITLSYNEAGRWMDGGERVDRVPMPPEVCEWLTEFVRLHWVPEAKHKQRGPKPSFMRREEFSKMIERERQGGAARGHDA